MSRFVRAIGYCGVDDSVAPELLQLISDRYDWVEWGVLFRTDLEGTARYPSVKWVERLVELNSTVPNGRLQMKLAGHLCGNRCQEVLDGNSAFVQQLYKCGFRRVQVNATAANSVVVDSAQTDQYVRNIISCMIDAPDMEFIIQCNVETRPICEGLLVDPPKNMSLLYDASCGKGVRVNSFPSPLLHPTVPCGYAGGIGPDCIEEILRAVKDVVATCPETTTVWVDMESSLRAIVLEKNKIDGSEVRRDVFSIDKCFTCILTADKGLLR
jgi:hypothetical protein